MKSLILYLVFFILFLSCSEGEDIGGWWGKVVIANNTAETVFVGSLILHTIMDFPVERTFQVNAYSSRIVEVADTREDLYSAKPDRQVLYNLEYFGFCLYSPYITNEKSVNYNSNCGSYWSGSPGLYHSVYIQNYNNPTNLNQQYFPPSLIYRMAITTNETLPDGRYVWEVPTNTRPFYLILASNTIVITSVMTNVTN